MCGINGFVGTDAEALERMNREERHRGPDFAGTFADGTVSLGHTLLSIRGKVSASHQPYTAPRSPWILLFNGQLYNTKQMRSALPAPYQGTSLDTALLFGLIETHGTNFIKHIEGMYAIALYHTREKILRLYRDPGGQKSLYYYEDGSRFIFSSEIRSIFAHEGIIRAADPEAVRIACALGYLPGTKTLFKNIRKVAPSEVVIYSTSERKLQREHFGNSATAYYERSPEKAFTELVAEHLQSERKVALNLSGGLDSSILLHEMAATGYEPRTYSTFFEGAAETYNRDALLARRLAQQYGANHKEITVTKKSFLENFTEAYELVEEPDYNISLPVYLQTAKTEGIHGDQNRVILSGNGGDEIFGGYPYYYQSRRMGRFLRILGAPLFNALKKHRSKTSWHFDDMYERWLFFKKLSFSAYAIRDTELREYIKQSAEPFLARYGRKHGDAYEMMLLDRALWMPGENFIQADKLFMSQSLEVRSPFSYEPFRAYFDGILSENDYADRNGNKVFLRKLYAGKLPDYITNRKDKTGWRSPLVDWYDASFKELFLSIITEADRSNPLIRWGAVRKRIEESESWPGKQVHLYLSLALLIKKYNLSLDV